MMKNEIPAEIFKAIDKEKQNEIDKMLRDGEAARFWLSSKRNIVYSAKDGQIKIFLKKAYISGIPRKPLEEPVKVDIDKKTEYINSLQRTIEKLVKENKIFSDYNICQYIDHIKINSKKKNKIQVQLSFVVNAPFGFKCIYNTVAPSDYILTQELIDKECKNMLENLVVTSVGSEIIEKIANEYVANINKKGYLLQDYLSLLQEVTKDNYGSGISFKKINEVISKNNYGSITINAFVRNNLIIFNFLHERCEYNIVDHTIKISSNILKKVEEFSVYIKEKNKLDDFCKKHNIKLHIKNANGKNIKCNVIKDDTSLNITIERPFLITTKGKEILTALSEKKKENRKIAEQISEQMNMVTNKTGGYLHKTICDLVSKNEHITENTIIRIVRNLSIQSDYHYNFSDEDRVYNLLSKETIQDAIQSLVYANVLRREDVKGDYGWYQRIKKGEYYNYFRIQTDGFTKKKWQNSKKETEFAFFLKRGDVNNDPQGISFLLKYPAVFCAEPAVKEYIKSISDYPNLDMYLELKKESERNNKERYNIIKEIQKIKN